MNNEYSKASKLASQAFKGGGNIKDFESRIKTLEKAMKKQLPTLFYDLPGGCIFHWMNQEGILLPLRFPKAVDTHRSPKMRL